ncbi:hypothetical protein FOZ63_007926, partial [Perkinsus olseni]
TAIRSAIITPNCTLATRTWEVPTGNQRLAHLLVLWNGQKVHPIVDTGSVSFYVVDGFVVRYRQQHTGKPYDQRGVCGARVERQESLLSLDSCPLLKRQERKLLLAGSRSAEYRPLEAGGTSLSE